MSAEKVKRLPDYEPSLVIDDDIDITIKGVTLSLGAAGFGEGMVNMDATAKMGIEDPKMLNAVLLGRNLMSRVVGWEGPVDARKKPAPCTPANVKRFFAQNEMLLMDFVLELQRAEKAAAENLSDTQAG